MSRLQRMWVNQPEAKHPEHKYHELLVLVNPASCVNGVVTVYFTNGRLLRARIARTSLSDGWPEHLTVAYARKAWLGDDFGHLNIYDALKTLRERHDAELQELREQLQNLIP